MPLIESEIRIPILHSADAAASTARSRSIRTLGLLGARPTLEEAFFQSRLSAHGLDILIPAWEEGDILHKIIEIELNRGILRDDSREEILRIIQRLYDQGVDGVLLACPEIGLIVSQRDTCVPLLEIATVHTEVAMTWALDANMLGTMPMAAHGPG